MAVTVKSYPNLQIDYSFTTSATIDSSEAIKNLWIDVSEAINDTYIEVVYNGVTITYNIVDEYKYTPLDIFFFNKEGQQQSFTFFKERKDTIELESNEYMSDNGQSSFGNHQYQKFNIQGRSSFKIFSGFIDEENNEIFKQMLLSERAWSYENNKMTPINIKTNKLVYKNRVNDRLVQYEIDIEYAYNEVNDI